MSGSSSSYDESTIPHCYRHPNRETYISCQRCGRPICPDCMRQASVGYQCPECVREGRVATRQARTSFGAISRASTSIVTVTLIAINVVVWILANVSERIYNELIMLPKASAGQQQFYGVEGVAQGHYWELITTTFLHQQFVHILLNMVGLWIFGSFLESQLGRLRYLGLYLVCGFVGSVTTYWVAAPNSSSLGASGAIFGLFAAALVVLLRLHRNVTQLLVLLALNLVITFTVPDIAWQAHVGGLFAGLVIGYAFAYAPRERRTLIHVGTLVLFTALAVAATVLRTAALNG
ncbi:MAG: rhomboid family intramembrane serine protease [Nocardioidaceae bacterium]